jgi:hypothetical protein
MKPRSIGAACCALALVLLSVPASASIVPCVSGNLSAIDGTTCDIGNLQFTFTGFVGTASGSGITPLTDSDFNFTVLTNGFELSGPPAQTIKAPSGIQEYDSAVLNYNVTDLTGVITGVDVSGGNLSVSGPGDSGLTDASNYIFLCSNGGCNEAISELNEVYYVSGIVYSNLGDKYASGGPISSGFGEAEPFVLDAGPGDTASIDSTTTYFTFTSFTAPVPEPSLLTLVSIGVLGLISATRSKIRR